MRTTEDMVKGVWSQRGVMKGMHVEVRDFTKSILRFGDSHCVMRTLSKVHHPRVHVRMRLQHSISWGYAPSPGAASCKSNALPYSAIASSYPPFFWCTSPNNVHTVATSGCVLPSVVRCAASALPNSSIARSFFPASQVERSRHDKS